MLIPYGFSDKTEEDYELLLYVNDVNRGYTETLATYGTDGYVNTVYTYGNERLISEQFGKSSYYTYNGRGDVSSQLSDTGAPQVSYSYDAYGNYAATAASDNPYKFNAEAFDYSTGLQYLRARYYDNSIGGFITQDSYRGTLTNPSTLNLYDYVGNDPINKIDPSGHWDVLNKIKKVGSSVLNVGKTIVTNVANTIKATATNVVNAVKNTVVSAVSIVKNAVVDTWNTVKNTVAAGLNKVSRFKSLVTNNSYIKKSTQTAENYSYKRDCDSFSYSKLTTAPVPISELINALLNAFYSFEDNPKGLDLKYENYCLGGLDMAPKFGPYDNDFPYDPNEKATMDDYISWHKWGFLNFGASFFMKDASRAYSHYRDGTGESMWINYERAYQEDSMIHDQLDKEAETIKSAAIYFYNQGAGTSFGIIGDKIAVPNGENENWQKTIGAHYAYAYSRVKVNETSKQMTITITYTMEDMYNFNKGMSDIASGTPDDVNGRFSVLGWAKEFKTYGSFSRSITFNY